MHILLCLAYISLFLFLIQRLSFFKLPELSKWAISGVFLLKLAAGLALYFLFTLFYKDRPNSDIFKYYDDSKVLFNAIYSDPLDYLKMLTGIHNNTPHFSFYYDQMFNWYRKLNSNLYNESHFIIRFNAIVRLFSFNVYFVHVIFVCFMSTAGLTGIYRFFGPGFSGSKRLLFICIFLYPSVLLWTSGLIKEAFIITFLGLLLSAIKNLLEKEKRFISIVSVLLCLFFLLSTKMYILVAFIPAILAYCLSYGCGTRKAIVRYGLVILAFISTAFLIREFLPDYDPSEVIRIKQADFLELSKRAGSRLDNPVLEASPLSLIKNAPRALYNSSLRPLNLMNGHAFIRMAAAENWILLIFAAFCLIYSRPFEQVNWNPVLMCILFSFILLLIVGWMTPVVGAIVRYKVPALPFLLVALLHLKRS